MSNTLAVLRRAVMQQLNLRSPKIQLQNFHHWSECNKRVTAASQDI